MTAVVRTEAAAGRPTVIVPNLNWRYSGVTATNRAIAPRVGRTLPVRWLGAYRPDDVLPLGFGGLLALRLSRPRTPIVWHARRNVEMATGIALRALGWPLKLVFTSAGQRRHRRFTRWLIDRMDAVIATSAGAASFLDRDAAIIEHGVDTDLFHPSADRDAEAAAAGLPGRYAIGCFGRVRHQKGTDVFVDAMCRLLPRYPDFCAIIVGEATAERAGFDARLRAQARDAGLAERIVFVGKAPIEDIPAWHRRMLIYAFTSRNEGFGLTLIEAMASASALVAARAGAAEIVVKDGDTGVLCSAGDADALVAAVEPLMRDPAAAAAMGRRARESVVAQFGIDAEAARIADVYRRLLG